MSDLVKGPNGLAKQDPHPKGSILDPHNNDGGVLWAAIGVSAALLLPGTTIVSTSGQVPDAKCTYKTTFANYHSSNLDSDPLVGLDPGLKTVPIIMLTDAYTAPASEIVAGVLQDHHHAKTIGKTTFDKGSVQTACPLSNDTDIRLTIAYYHTSSGKSVQAKGIRPDILVDQNPDGDPDDALITREIDTERHLHNKQGSEEAEMTEHEKRRVEELRRLEEESVKETPEQREGKRNKKPIEFGSAEGSMPQQVPTDLKGQPIKRLKSMPEAAAAAVPDKTVESSMVKDSSAPAKLSKGRVIPVSEPPAPKPNVPVSGTQPAPKPTGA